MRRSSVEPRTHRSGEAVRPRRQTSEKAEQKLGRGEEKPVLDDAVAQPHLQRTVQRPLGCHPLRSVRLRTPSPPPPPPSSLDWTAWLYAPHFVARATYACAGIYGLAV